MKNGGFRDGDATNVKSNGKHDEECEMYQENPCISHGF